MFHVILAISVFCMFCVCVFRVPHEFLSVNVDGDKEVERLTKLSLLSEDVLKGDLVKGKKRGFREMAGENSIGSVIEISRMSM